MNRKQPHNLITISGHRNLLSSYYKAIENVCMRNVLAPAIFREFCIILSYNLIIYILHGALQSHTQINTHAYKNNHQLSPTFDKFPFYIFMFQNLTASFVVINK